jgi:hypothetical protein
MAAAVKKFAKVGVQKAAKYSRKYACCYGRVFLVTNLWVREMHILNDV